MTNDDGKASAGERTRSPHLLSSVARSHSNGAPSNSTNSNPNSNTNTALYHPSIFRYTCSGKLSLDSRNGGQSKASAGVCRGIQSKLEHIDHWRLSTREEAIKQFEYRSSVDIGGAEDDYYNSGGASGDHTGASSAAHAEQAVYISNVLLYPPPAEGGKDESDETGSDRGKRKKRSSKIKETMTSRKNTDGSTTIRPREDKVDCYGSTEVDLLVLRPQNAKDESIAGVAPFCSPGVTVRDVAISPTNIGMGSETGGRERTTTMRLGILEIVYATVLEGLEEDELNNMNSNNDNNNSSGTTNQNQKPAGNEPGNGDNSSSTPESKGWVVSGAPMRVVSSGKKILNHMSINGKLLYQTVQDDYPQRTYEASKRITNEFHKTWDRTTGLMKKVASVALFGDDWDDEDDDQDGRR
eukprot:jgi/Psemu1/55256/gm1.55256_g